MEQKDPEKKIPSTAAKATNRSAKEVSLPTRKKNNMLPEIRREREKIEEKNKYF